MYAVVVRETGDVGPIDASGDHLAANVAPRVRQAPGIVSGFWTSDGGGGTLNVFLFETEDAANDAMQAFENSPRPPFIHLESVTLHRVLAEL
jgi:hypothetical protein